MQNAVPAAVMVVAIAIAVVVGVIPAIAIVMVMRTFKLRYGNAVYAVYFKSGVIAQI